MVKEIRLNANESVWQCLICRETYRFGDEALACTKRCEAKKKMKS